MNPALGVDPDRPARLAANRDAADRFLALARAVPADRWGQPRAPGKWSPAQLVEHVALAYETYVLLLHGAVPGGPPRWIRPVVRKLMLDGILRRGTFPGFAPAPAILEPGESPAGAPAPDLVQRLEGAARSFDAEAAAHPSATLDHPWFGRMPVTDLVRLAEIHTRHHSRQLPQ